MRTAVTNPFSPGSDDVPVLWAGRQRQLSDFVGEVRPRRSAGLYERGRLFLGEPGVGKSVLVGRIAATARQDGDWVTGQIRIPVGADPFQLVAEALVKVARDRAPEIARERTLGKLFRRVEKLGAAGVQVDLRAPDGRLAHRELFDMIVALATRAHRAGQVLLVHLDEVQNMDAEEHASALLTAVGDALSHTSRVQTPGGGIQEVHLPLAVYLTGLPEFADTATARRGATFTRRFATTILGPLRDEELREALVPLVAGYEVEDGNGSTTHVVMDPDAADAIVQASYRDPFLFQLVGARTWLADSGHQITPEDVQLGAAAARSEVLLHVDRLLTRLPNLQRDFVDAMVAIEPAQRKVSAIARALGYDGPQQLGSTTQALEAKGIIERGRPYRLRVPALEARLTGALSPGWRVSDSPSVEP